jgi:hypothetical protein
MIHVGLQLTGGIKKQSVSYPKSKRTLTITCNMGKATARKGFQWELEARLLGVAVSLL